MPSYFRQVPDFEYVSRDPNQRQISEYATVKNLFRRGKLRDDIFGNLSYFTKYKIIGDERPDNVAYKLYNDETLDWVILLSNNILNIQTEWPLPQIIFDKVLLEKYGSYDELYNGIHHYETKEIRDSVGNLILPEGIKMPNQWKSANGFIQGYKGVGIISRIVYQNDEIEIYTNQDNADIKPSLQIEIKNVVDSAINGIFTIKSVIPVDENNDGITDFLKFKFDLKSTEIISGTIDDNISTCDNISFITCDINSTVYNFESPSSNNGTELQVTGNESIEYISSIPLSISNNYFYQYYDNNLQRDVLLPSNSILTPITNYEYESEIENNKRNIFVLKPQYLNIVFNDMEEIMTYKKGSTQYVSRTLKRGENIRLFQ